MVPCLREDCLRMDLGEPPPTAAMKNVYVHLLVSFDATTLAGEGTPNPLARVGLDDYGPRLQPFLIAEGAA